MTRWYAVLTGDLVRSSSLSKEDLTKVRKRMDAATDEVNDAY